MTDWKRCLLEDGKMAERDFRGEMSAVQLPRKVINWH